MVNGGHRFFIMSKEQIEILVYQRYPLKKKEETCMSFKCERDGVREAYRKRLKNEHGVSNIKQATKN